jgi:hypothetical protein
MSLTNDYSGYSHGPSPCLTSPTMTEQMMGTMIFRWFSHIFNHIWRLSCQAIHLATLCVYIYILYVVYSIYYEFMMIILWYYLWSLVSISHTEITIVTIIVILYICKYDSYIIIFIHIHTH